MRELAVDLLAWAETGRPFAVASLIEGRGSTPRRIGAAMAVDDEGRVLGNLSGGCVDAAVYELARTAIAEGVSVIETFSATSDESLAPGIPCGGTVRVLVQPMPPGGDAGLVAALRAVADDRCPKPVALARRIDVPRPAGGGLAVFTDDVHGTVGDPELDARLITVARGMLADRRTGIVTPPDGPPVFVEVWSSPPALVIVGANEPADALARIAGQLGYQTTVCDPRPQFATRRRLPHVDVIAVEWPHRYLATAALDDRSAVCVLTHDPRIDVPALTVALRQPVGYVGAMGSRRTRDMRTGRLRDAGVPAGQLSRLRSPIGLDLGGHTPEEMAVSIAAELVAVRHAGSGLPLSETGGPVHERPAPESEPPVPIPTQPGNTEGDGTVSHRAIYSMTTVEDVAGRTTANAVPDGRDFTRGNT
ncbi:xanthine dehydrogenase accessory factor [Stackebrandtia albiflava]|uniref:Xanthine dehydrogenase accessory factor n=1 Tax=Stackebrandtia albiflava TaxID=406432 RepID=A0A562V9N0_9ACTN|nr:XdhC/CoxI family protein [Stackebrandtia albiflava]TWJ14565.1 xanthine dehydrogenase accessory factor [Stackebrandtia albiflava]